MSQIERLLEVLKDKQPHSNFGIMERMYPQGKQGLFRLGARIWDLKGKGYEIEAWHDKENSTKYWYQLISTPNEKIIPKFITEQNGQLVLV